MSRKSLSLHAVLIVTAAAVMVLGMAGVGEAQAPVSISTSVTGTAVPGGTVTAKAQVTINDGSTFQSISWAQAAGAPAALTGAGTDTVSVTLGSQSDFKAALFHVLAEPPIGADELPPNVPVPPGEFPGGQQDRFEVVGMSPFAIEEAGVVEFEVTVTTSSGSYHAEAEVHVSLPWAPTAGIRNVPLGVPVLLHGKAQASYDWSMLPPAGSAATLIDATGQTPEFTPDVMGRYAVSVTELASGQQVTLSIYAGTWKGVIVGQDADGRPVADTACTSCHSNEDPSNAFSKWRQTGHAEIFTNSLNTNDHYSSNCFACHSVGYDTAAANNGIDDQPDYQAFLDSELIHDTTGEEWTQMLERFPAAARMGNIQCENCHGPQVSGAHPTDDGARTSLSSNVCAPCHGEPLRHARFQQWQLSAHANYEVAIDESSSGSCARCHTGNGFLAWLPVLLGDEPGDPLDDVEVTWTEDEAHPQTCQTCHDPHAIGTTSGNNPNATVRISGDTPPLIAGFTATDVGKGAICLTCHNTRRGLRNDTNYGDDITRAPHPGAQGDVVMGQNAYFVKVGQRGYHSRLENTCADCHMRATPPPDELSYNQGGSNHTFYASPDICSDCHAVIRAEDVQAPFEAKLEELEHAIEGSIMALVEQQLAAGRTVRLGSAATITNAADVVGIEFTESRGRQAITVTFRDGSEVGPTAMNSVSARGASGSSTNLYDLADESLPKAGWNFFLLHSDGSHGVHNTSWSNSIVDLSLFALKTAASGGGVGPGGGGGIHPGDGTGGVACADGFVYWTEIATSGEGLFGSIWRTDLVTRNTAAEPADLDFVFHTSSGDIAGTSTIEAGAQGVFEDVVAMMGGADKGTMEICSTQPLEVVERIYNQSDTGTFGQFVDGFAGGGGLTAGGSARLLGLRQLEGAFRTNINVANTGTGEAEVAVTLFSTAGAQLTSYELTVGSGMVVQDIEPFKSRAGQADLGWGFAIVEVLSGEGVVTSASVIDSRTNDGTTIPMKL